MEMGRRGVSFLEEVVGGEGTKRRKEGERKTDEEVMEEEDENETEENGAGS